MLYSFASLEINGVNGFDRFQNRKSTISNSVTYTVYTTLSTHK